MNTIVTAFISNANNFRNIEKYIEYGKKLLTLSICKVVFIEKNIYDEYLKKENEMNNSFPNTQFIFMERNQIYLYNYIQQINDFQINTDNPSKDSLDYLFVQCHKTEWVKIAIQYNVFQTEQFIWIDFGISHIFRDNDQLFQNCILDLSKKSYNNIRIASGWNTNNLIHFDIDNNTEFLKNISWYFLGGIFGGDKEKCIDFADRMREKCLDIISKKMTFTWEVNIWCLIYKEKPELFDFYSADHNFSMIQSY
jgi:hypothetical protein